MAKIYERKYKHKTTYYAHFTNRGVRYRIKLEAQNRAQAKQMAADAEYKILSGNYDYLKKETKKTLREVADRYIEFAKSEKKSWDRDVISLNNILEMEIDNKKLGDYYVDQIKVVHVQKYQIRRKRELDKKFEKRGINEQDRNYATVNRELACLKHIFNIAIEWEIVQKNPVASKVIKFSKEIERERTLTDEEFRLLLTNSAGHLNLAIIIALNTGMRLGEILNLPWQNIDLTERKIYIIHTKNGENRDVPINDYLHSILINETKGNEYLIYNRNGKPIKSIKTAWNTLKNKLGINDLRFHDLRHTAATRMAKGKATESVIAKILGHKRRSITSRYINPMWDEMVEAVEILGSLCHEFDTNEEKHEMHENHNSNKIIDIKMIG